MSKIFPSTGLQIFYRVTLNGFLVLFLLSNCTMSFNTQIKLKIKENLPNGTSIARLFNEIIPRPPSSTILNLMKNNYFTIIDSDNLISIAPIDRDLDSKLCNIHQDKCVWKSYITLSSGIIYFIEIEVLDLNDNVPKWIENFYQISITENSAISTFEMELPKAVDPDLYPNNICKYSVEPSSKYVNISNRNISNEIKPYLKLKQIIDRELLSWHNITITATDCSTKNSLTGSTFLFIEIIDQNDNKPLFNSSIYKKTINRHLAPNQKIDLKILASDLDSGLNSKITYKFSLEVSLDVRDCFSINSTTAIITVLKNLVNNCPREFYEFTILALDNGIPQLSDKSTIHLRFIPQNLNNPEIIFSNFKEPIEIQENQRIFNLDLVRGFVKDKDKGTDGEFKCNLTGNHSNSFQMIINQTGNENLSFLKIRAVDIFDREKINKFHLDIFCQDLGIPPLTSRKSITVVIRDENDNGPQFDRNFYVFECHEESSPNERLAQIRATDKDEGSNAHLSFELNIIDPDKNNVYVANENSSNSKSISSRARSASADILTTSLLNQLLEIDRFGQIKAGSLALDRETFPNGIQFQVIAKDGGQPSKSASVRVNLILIDVNDNPPIFDRGFYNFTLTEDSGNNFQQQDVCCVTATDKDINENGKLIYQIGKNIPLLFKVDSQSGKISTTSLLDREDTPGPFLITIEAMDSPQNLLFRKTTTVSVHIYVKDINDNSPVFTSPSESNKILLSYHSPVGSVVTQMKAYDKDEGDNSRLEFSLVDPERNILFAIDSQTGVLTTSTIITKLHEGKEVIFIKARDMGHPPLSSIRKLTIVLGNFELRKTNDRSSSNNNNPQNDSSLFLSDRATFVIVGIVLVTFCVCCILIGCVCILAYKRWRCHRRRTRSSISMTQMDRNCLGNNTNFNYDTNSSLMTSGIPTRRFGGDTNLCRYADVTLVSAADFAAGGFQQTADLLAQTTSLCDNLSNLQISPLGDKSNYFVLKELI